LHLPPESQEPRALSEEERLLVEDMLERSLPVSAPFLEQLHRARVVSRCPCGCASINFAIEGRSLPKGGLRVIADFVFGDEATLCGAFVFEQGGVLGGLEVYGLSAEAPRRLPRTEELRPFQTETKAR
jgi:hypothetical protein